MKLIITLTTIVGLIGLSVNAETTWVNEAIEAEIQEETGEPKNRKGSQNIFIVNKNDSEARAKNQNTGSVKATQTAEAQNQPETIVEASPLVESYATNLRKMRENAELETEQKIVEKLESARLEDERRRANRLFGDRQFESPRQKKMQQDTPSCSGQGCWVPVEQAPVQVIEQAPVHQPVQVIQQPTAPVVVPTVNYEHKAHTKKSFISKSYISAGLGNVSYQAENVESKYAWQAGVGFELSERASVEASFVYSQHRVDEFFGPSNTRIGSYGFTDLDQYNWGVEGKYNLLSRGKLNLYAGGQVALVMRNYFGKNQSTSRESEESTKSVNVAPIIGAELQLSRNVSVGLDYRYMKSMVQKFSSDEMKHSHYDSRSNYKYEPLEDIDYSLISLKAKVSF